MGSSVAYVEVEAVVEVEAAVEERKKKKNVDKGKKRCDKKVGKEYCKTVKYNDEFIKTFSITLERKI